MYFTLLLLIVFAAGYADFQFLTNFKASILMAIGTAIVVFLNYFISIASVNETSVALHKTIFSCWSWYKDEARIALGMTLLSLIIIGVIFLVWYLPKGYSVDWSGLGIALTIVPVVSIISGILGTRRGIAGVVFDIM